MRYDIRNKGESHLEQCLAPPSPQRGEKIIAVPSSGDLGEQIYDRFKHLTFTTLFITLTVILLGCQSQAPQVAEEVVEEIAPTATVAAVEEVEEPDTPTLEPTEPPPTATATNLPPTDTPIPELTETPVKATADEAEIPLSPIFDLAWDDRTPFEAGLISSEQGILDELDGATVYHIEMSLSDDMQMVTARQAIRYTNTEQEDLAEVYFRLFPNLAGGSTVVENLTVDGEAIEPIYELEDSAMQVPLATSLQPGQAIEIAMDFTVTVPDTEGGNYGTFAYLNNILALAHFYPMIAVYDDEGWNLEIAPAIGDVVYADASFYLVQITAPDDQQLVTSGVEIEREEKDDQQIITVAAGPMRDFYLAASDTYEMVSTTVGETTINSFATADLTEGSENALQHAADAVESFNERFGIYPYTEFDMVPISTQALGIEYPGIVANLIILYDTEAQLGNLPSSVLLEATVVHEVAHQWFYALVGNDQLDEPWLDEAMAQFATLVYYSDVYGPAGAAGFYQSLEGRWNRVDQADIPIGLPVRDYTAQEYGAIVYGRGPLFVEALSTEMGSDIFGDFILDYSLKFRYGIASSQDFQDLAEAHCDCELKGLFAEWVYAE